MSGFASLEPCYTARLTFDAPRNIGNLGRGGQAMVAHINGGTFTSETGVEPQINAVFEFGADHFLIEPDLQTVRIDVKACLKNSDESIISYQYVGTIKVTPEYIPVLSGSPDAKTTPFGNVFTHVTLESGAEQLKELQRSRYVGCSRFIIEEGKPLVIESKIAKAVYSA